jgi:hypothetical protein
MSTPWIIAFTVVCTSVVWAIILVMLLREPPEITQEKEELALLQRRVKNLTARVQALEKPSPVVVRRIR